LASFSPSRSRRGRRSCRTRPRSPVGTRPNTPAGTARARGAA